MRPSIDISHELNGRVKDFAEKYDLDIDGAYSEIINVGLYAIENAEGDELDELLERK